ncbi:hypothetical protein CAPTEDRAFT_220786 [Capitella teleta]|uniref:NAD-capped RNA hydrolase NUDT12 n=1 Tax=Capitella teleta TaxID=283909 RepID=R7U2G6_CAPTE|nr:hypothetical protein CAPTEDRAFT_228617 [Capitella teleta]ELT97831.1 hypothetical protein CAPTEDRAFT_220786 [Capitella teleta]|eukprot:ELT96544.1 hypothetical protein CAPTEDRAFT_228617 [Capitella teleta]
MDKHDIYETYVEKFHEAAAGGDTDLLDSAVKVLPNLNVKNDKGWTALMFAARNGHANVVKLLLDRGCDCEVINSTGQTALGIAQFWNQHKVVELLEAPPSSSSSSGPVLQTEPGVTNFLCGSPLDRRAEKRKDKKWLDEALKGSSVEIISFHNLSPVVKKLPDLTTKGLDAEYRLMTSKYADLSVVFHNQTPAVIFLGVDPSGEVPWFAVDVSHVPEEKIKDIHPYAEIMGYRSIFSFKKAEAAICGQARTLLAWHDRYQFCPTCGAKTTIEEGGYKRKCTDANCRSLKGTHNTCYPRVDPTVIMAVVSPDGKQLLLGRGSKFPPLFFSCLAGFVEPGESIEEACRREVFEEAGVCVGHVQYHSCQPWPMPASLMIGCIAHATSTDITIDHDELEEARWFSRQEVIQILTSQHPQRLSCPPEFAIAHQIIRSWVNMTSNL